MPPKRNRGWIVGLAVAGILTVVVAGTAVVAQVFGRKEPDVDVGECIKKLPDHLGVSGFSAEPCGEPHAGEVFAVIPDPSGGADHYPGAGALMRSSAQQCLDAFPAYAGTTLTRSGLVMATYFPDRAAWQHGSRSLICVLSSEDGELVGSRRGEPPSSALPAERGLYNLEVADCFDGGGLDAGTAAAVELAACDAPHTFEVVGTRYATPDVSFDELEDFVEDSCHEMFETYVGIDFDASDLDMYWLASQEENWVAGQGRVICFVGLGDEDLVGSVQGTEQ